MVANGGEAGIPPEAKILLMLSMSISVPPLVWGLYEVLIEVRKARANVDI